MPRISNSFNAINVRKAAMAIVFLLILALTIFNSFFFAQAALIERENEELQRDYDGLMNVIEEMKGGNQILAETYLGVYKETGQFPIKLNYTAFDDNKTRIYCFYYSTCLPCIEDHNTEYAERLPAWTMNISVSDFESAIINAHPHEDGDNLAKTIFSTLGINEEDLTIYLQDSIIALNNLEGFIFSWKTQDDSIRSAMVYLTNAETLNGSDVDGNNFTPQQNAQTVDFLPLIYLLTGFSQGFNPCLIALVSFIIATTLYQDRATTKALKRVIIITFSVFYTYLLFGFLLVTSTFITDLISLLTIPMALLLAVIGVIHFAEVGHDLLTGKWKTGKEAKLPLFKTPKKLKKLIQRTATQENSYFDFVVGSLFSLIKLPCIAPLFLTLVVAIPHKPTSALVSISALNLGAALPILTIGSLACIGFLKASQLSGLRFKGRIIQRIVIGASLVLSAVVIFFTIIL